MWKSILSVRKQSTWKRDTDETMKGSMGSYVSFERISKDLAKLYGFNAPSPSQLKEYLDRNYEKHPLYANMWKGAKK